MHQYCNKNDKKIAENDAKRALGKWNHFHQCLEIKQNFYDHDVSDVLVLK